MPTTTIDAVHESARSAIDLHRAHLGRGRSRLAAMFGDLVEASAKGSTITATDGREFLNCGGYGVFFTGAGHPRVLAAVEAQLHRQALSSRLFLDPTAGHAAEALARVAPSGLDRMHFSSSGAEAVETAIKLARIHGKDRLVSMVDGYHGKTMGALSLTAKSLYQDPFRPLLANVTHAAFGDASALKEVLRSAGGRACVVVEPVQSEGGVILPPAGYLREVSRLCREHQAFLVIDEVMTGLGRLGTWWGCAAEDVSPDVILVGKALSGAVMPVAATLATERVFAPFDDDPFLHTSTFSAAPIAMAAVRATVEVIEDEALVERSAQTGARLLAGLRAIVADRGQGVVSDVRGAGLLIGIELSASGLAGELMLELVDHGIVANHSLNAHPVIRFTPPATLTPNEESRLLEAVDSSLAALARTFT